MCCTTFAFCVQHKFNYKNSLFQNLEEFIRGSGDAGFIYFSMGSSVKAANMPEYLRRLLMCVFRQLPQRVLWKWEADEDMHDLPANVKLARWLPQQDLLGKILTHVSHMKVFCLSWLDDSLSFTKHFFLLARFVMVIGISFLFLFCAFLSYVRARRADTVTTQNMTR